MFQGKLGYAFVSRAVACAAMVLCGAVPLRCDAPMPNAPMADAAPLEPLTVCEVLRGLPAYEGKTVVVAGRYSFRQNGRWLGEQACEAASSGAPLLWLVEDPKNAPKPPSDFELDAVVLRQKLTEIQRHTSLGKFKFGSPDYDRWAVVYGRVEARKGDAAKQAPANLVYRGSGVIVFLTPEG